VQVVRNIPVPILAAFAAFGLAACGGGGSANASSTTTTTTAGRGFQSAAFTNCLKQHGVTLPAGGFGGRRPDAGTGGTGGPGGTGGTPGTGGFRGGGGPAISIPGVSASQIQTAFSACRSQLPNGGRFGGGGFGGGNPAALQAYLSCLRDHGVTIPTTTSGSTPARPGSELRAVRNSPNFAAANKTCQVLLPTSGSSTTTTTG
jgi:hypothetical protein